MEWRGWIKASAFRSILGISLLFFSRKFFDFLGFLLQKPQEKKKRWERLQLQREDAPGMGAVEISGPGKRWGHTCNAIKGGKLLYIFGGYGKDNCQTNQVHVFDSGGCS